jgi:hypothetical protein
MLAKQGESRRSSQTSQLAQKQSLAGSSSNSVAEAHYRTASLVALVEEGTVRLIEEEAVELLASTWILAFHSHHSQFQMLNNDHILKILAIWEHLEGALPARTWFLLIAFDLSEPVIDVK